MNNRSDGILSVSEFPSADRPGHIADRASSLIKGCGYVYLKDVPGGFDHLSFLAEFGDFMPQYDGELVWDLKPEPDMDDLYHSRNTQALVPHTEGYEYPGRPPHYVALWCIRRAQGPGGATTLADGARLLARFTADERRIMRERAFEWHSSEGLARKNIHVSARHPILEQYRGYELLRYSYNNVTRDGDEFLEKYLELGNQFFEAEHEAFTIEENCLLLWDNWRMLHSRTAFEDRERHLKRVLVG